MNTKELHNDLIKKFAAILYQWQHPLTLNDQVDDDLLASRETAMCYYFASDATAHYALKALVASAIQTYEWHSMSPEQRHRAIAETHMAMARALESGAISLPPVIGRDWPKTTE